jgi:predicted nucleotidyltransferase
MDIFLHKENILKTLLYYDIFSHPLKKDEIYIFLPRNSLPKTDVIDLVDKFTNEEDCHFAQKNGYVYIKPNHHYVELRQQKEEHARKMWRTARLVTHIIKRFPFVRAVFITGSLSKNSTDKTSDIDFMVVTADQRLWVARTLLMLFKKLFLLNSYKFFCLNFFITENNLEIEEKNYFSATEVAHIKATFNSSMMHQFILKNLWIKKYFPNYIPGDPKVNSAGFKVNNRVSFLQKFFEISFFGAIGDKLDNYFKQKMINFWKRKYGYLNESDLNFMFKSTNSVSRAHPGNMQKVILGKYSGKLKQFNLDMNLYD